jgi:copper(I)-binding protein
MMIFQATESTMRLPKIVIMLCCLHIGMVSATSALQLENVTVRQPLPGKTVSAGYFSVTNPTNQPLQIVAVRSQSFAKTELHQHRMVDGMMKMEAVTQINIPANSTVHLQPGGLHLMLFRPEQALELGQQIPLEIELSSGDVLKTHAVVTRIPKQ